jgi:hypothetical protein
MAVTEKLPTAQAATNDDKNATCAKIRLFSFRSWDRVKQDLVHESICAISLAHPGGMMEVRVKTGI